MTFWSSFFYPGPGLFSVYLCVFCFFSSTLFAVFASVSGGTVAAVGVPLADAHSSVLTHIVRAKVLLCGTTWARETKTNISMNWYRCSSRWRLGCNCENLRLRTFRGAVVSDEASHVDGFAVDGEVPHAAHKVTIPDREILRQVGNTAEQQGSSQVQWPVGDIWKSG